VRWCYQFQTELCLSLEDVATPRGTDQQNPISGHLDGTTTVSPSCEDSPNSTAFCLFFVKAETVNGKSAGERRSTPIPDPPYIAAHDEGLSSGRPILIFDFFPEGGGFPIWKALRVGVFGVWAGVSSFRAAGVFRAGRRFETKETCKQWAIYGTWW